MKSGKAKNRKILREKKRDSEKEENDGAGAMGLLQRR